MAIVAHNTAAWVVREAIVQSQYEDFEKVPVGLVDVALPYEMSHQFWNSKANWEDFRRALLKHLMKTSLNSKTKPAEQEAVVPGSELGFETIKNTTWAFDEFRSVLEFPQKDFRIVSICCSGPKVRVSLSRSFSSLTWSGFTSQNSYDKFAG